MFGVWMALYFLFVFYLSLLLSVLNCWKCVGLIKLGAIMCERIDINASSAYTWWLYQWTHKWMYTKTLLIFNKRLLKPRTKNLSCMQLVWKFIRKKERKKEPINNLLNDESEWEKFYHFVFKMFNRCIWHFSLHRTNWYRTV